MKPSLLAASVVALSFAAAGAYAQDDVDDTVVVTGQPTEPTDVLIETGDDGASDDGLEPSAPALAPSGSEAVVSYSPDYFRPYSPTSAQDMVNRVPGFNAQGGGNARGFGANAGNVLINGERPSSKSQDTGDILQRIPVSEVVRIDLIRGQVAGIDMGGQSVVVNVIRRVSTRSGGTWRAQMNYNSHIGVVKPNGEVNWNTQFLGANVSLGLNLSQFANGEERTETIRGADGELISFARGNSKGGRPLGYQISMNADRDLGAWTLRLNGRIDKGGFGNEEYLQAELGPYFLETSMFDNDQLEWELGGDLERELTDNLSVKFIALQNWEDQEGANAFQVFDSSGFVRASMSESEATSGESIVRGFLTWNPSDNYSIEVGAEAAYNFRDSANDIFIDTGSGPVPVPLTIDETKVEELRAEPFVSALWRPTSDIVLDVALQAEVSEIKQSGDASQTRSFFYPKGSAGVTWDALDRTQFRFSLERSVGQLSFGDFASSVSFNDDTQDTGNPDLVPEQSWRVEGILEQRFWDDGVFSLELRREWIEDTQGLVPLGDSGAVGIGSMGDATSWRFRAEADIPLDNLLWDDARIQTSYSYGGSEVTDPFTGEERELGGGGGNFFGGGGGGRRNFNFNFRKDHPDAQFSWGFGYNNSSTGFSYRQNELSANSSNQGGIDAWVETTRFFGVNMRLQVNNIGNFYNDRYRVIYEGLRAETPIELTEFRRQYNDIGFSFRVRGTF